MSSLYIHIPFCKSKCHYCAFNSYPKLDSLFERYFIALKKELVQLDLEKPLRTIFFGGGTPTILGAERLAELVVDCGCFSIDTSVEVTVEANPETINHKGLKTLKEAGVNRISFGVQSFKDEDLSLLGREHSVKRVLEVVEEARQVGITNINLDLMSALPNQTVTSWVEILNKAISLKPKHLSVYQLTPEEDTKFYDQYVAGTVALPDDQSSFDMDEVTKEICDKNGLTQYEISNYAKDDCRCLHNINYWENNDYFAVGAGAISFQKGCRERRVDSPREYCERLEVGKPVIIESENLEPMASFRETVIMGLRMVEGVALERLHARYSIDPITYYGASWRKFEDEGLVEVKDGNIRITDKGRPLSNSIMAELV